MRNNRQCNQEWFDGAITDHSENNQRIAILDLDKTLFWNTSEPGVMPVRFSLQIIYPTFCIYADPLAFEQLKAFQSKGHTIKVITAGMYTYKEILPLFNSHGISLDHRHYFNRINLIENDCYHESQNGPHVKKADFIDKNPEHFPPEVCMLFDDQAGNAPKNIGFFLVTAEPFPSFQHEANQPLAFLSARNTLFTHSFQAHQQFWQAAQKFLAPYTKQLAILMSFYLALEEKNEQAHWFPHQLPTILDKLSNDRFQDYFVEVAISHNEKIYVNVTWLVSAIMTLSNKTTELLEYHMKNRNSLDCTIFPFLNLPHHKRLQECGLTYDSTKGLMMTEKPRPVCPQPIGL